MGSKTPPPPPQPSGVPRGNRWHPQWGVSELITTGPPPWFPRRGSAIFIECNTPTMVHFMCQAKHRKKNTNTTTHSCACSTHLLVLSTNPSSSNLKNKLTTHDVHALSYSFNLSASLLVLSFCHLPLKYILCCPAPP